MNLYTMLIVTTMLVIECLKIVVGTSLHPMYRNDHYMNRMQQFCGQRLTNELDILCGGELGEINGNKNRRQKRGITDECCSRPCSRNYIKMNYCLPLNEEILYADSPNLSPIEEVDYLGYYFELLGRVLEPISED